MRDPDSDGSKRKLLAYMEGLRKGFSLLAASDGQFSDPDFLEGWERGRELKKEEAARAQKKYGATLSVLRTI